MHIKKNVCDNVFGTIMNIERKSKDGKKARMDLIELGIRKELHIDEEVNYLLHAIRYLQKKN